MDVEKKKRYDKQWEAANAERRRQQKKQYRAANADRSKQYYADNVERFRERRKQYNAANAERERKRAREWEIANPERTKERKKQYGAANAERLQERAKQYYAANTDRIKQRVKEYREANAEQVKEQKRLYVLANIERVKKNASNRIKRWKTANPDRQAAQKRERRARQVAAEGSHTAADVNAIWLRQGKKCAVKGCAHPITDVPKHPDIYHVDHIMPLKPQPGNEKGTNWPDNLQILCRTHNLQKNNRDPYEWAQKNGRLF